MIRLFFFFAVFFAIAFGSGTSQQRAAKVITSLLLDPNKDALFGRVVSRYLPRYFTNEIPWGLSSLMSLQEYFSVLRQEGSSEHNIKEEEKLDVIRIKIFFTALLPPDMDKNLFNVCVAFCRRILGEEGNLSAYIMLGTYNYVHHGRASNYELLDEEVLDSTRPIKGVYALMRRFQKLYPKERLEKVLFEEIDKNDK